MNLKLLFLVLFSTQLFGQNKFTVYFATNSYQLSQIETNRLEDYFRNKNVKFIKIIGYCDHRASESYNDALSINRANYVYNQIKKASDQDKIKIEGKGENFRQLHQLKKNRKVEILFEEILPNYTLNSAQNNLTNQISNSKIGDKLILKNLYFYNRSGTFVPKSKPVLEELLTLMKYNPKLKIEIQGHICCQEGTDIEDTAKIRALAVYNFLIKNGIEANRLSFKSFGSSQPIHHIPEKNETERNENRRVEILIVDN